MFYFKITPPVFPPTMYILQPGLTHVVHGKLPGFTPIPAMYKIKIKTVYSSQFSPSFELKLRSVAQLVPVFVSTDMAGQLDVPGLNFVPVGMDGEEVGIFHHVHQVAL